MDRLTKIMAMLAVYALAISKTCPIPVSEEGLAVQTTEDIVGNIEGNIVS